MFLAAFTSASAAWPQWTHRNTAWVFRFSAETCPQDGQGRRAPIAIVRQYIEQQQRPD
jgi:hypothetical protein